MDTLQQELSELKQFIVDLKADRAATKEKEKREAWTKYVSLSISIIAVLAAIASQKAGKYSGQTLMNQVRASDEWSFYQAQSIKQHVFEMARAQLVKTGDSPDALQQQKDYKAKLDVYEKKKEESNARAKALEKNRDDAMRMGASLGPAVSYFTVSLAVGSLCLITKKKPLWILSLVLAGVGLLYWWGLMQMLFDSASRVH